MRLLVSVANVADASAALAGGADVIDAKDPAAGALGPVSPVVLREIHACVGRARLLTAALGDARDEKAIERTAREFTDAGATLVKVGFAGSSISRAGALLDAAVRGAQPRGIIAVAYADSDDAEAPDSHALIDAAADAGATGILLDTFNKRGPGLRELLTSRALSAWVAAARARGLLVAVAGKLTLDDLSFVRDAGADIAGVRSAACAGGRMGHVSVERVRLLRAQVAAPAPSDVEGPAPSDVEGPAPSDIEGPTPSYVEGPSRSAELSASLSSARITNVST
jgi:uncharacterized protein (UPF0264 family)